MNYKEFKNLIHYDWQTGFHSFQICGKIVCTSDSNHCLVLVVVVIVFLVTIVIMIIITLFCSFYENILLTYH